MKKRLLSALLALALVFVLLPTTALAETPTQNADIYIAGTGWNFEKDGSTYQTVYYQIQSSKGVFLKEFGKEFGKVWTTNPYLEITRVGNDVTITVHGDMKISSNDSCIESAKSYSGDINLIITGTRNDTLTLTNSSIGDAIYSHNGDVTIKGGITVNAYSTCTNPGINNARGIYVHNHNLTISGANTKVNVESMAAYSTVKVDGTITVSGGAQLNATNKYYGDKNTDKAYAIECGQLSISDDKTQVTAYTSNGEKAISGTVYNLTENDDYKLTFKAAKYKGSQIFLQRPMDEALGYKYVEITQAPTDPYVFIAGEPAIMDQETPIPGGSGTYLYVDAGYDGNILTLKDATINKTSNNDTNAIKFTDAGTYTVNLEGTNKMSGVGTGILAANVKGEAIDVIISGSGSLDISARSRTIEVSGNLTFNNTGTINLKTTNTADDKINAIKVSGDISVGSDFNKNLKITTDNGDFMLGVSDLNSLNKCKSITIAPKPSKTYYNGTAMKYGETRTVGNGTISCDEKGVITLNGVTEGTLEFRSSADSTLVLEGTNTLSSIVTTQKGLTISGSGSLTAGSIKVTNNDNIRANLTITDGAKVTVNRPGNEDARAIDIKGDLTVTSGSLTATSTSTKPTVQVGGNASFTGSTVTITNNSTTQGKSGKNSYEVSTGLYVGGTLDIKNAAKVTSTVTGGNAIYAKGDITISGDGTEVNAQNSAYKFSAISTKTVNISDNSTVKAENLKKHQGDPTGVTDPSTGKTYNACPAITGKIANKNTQNKLHIEGFTTSNPGTSNPTDGVVLNFDINPSSVEPFILHYDVTITRGDEVARTESPVVIAGTTLLNDTYYTITNGSTVAEGTDSNNYNAFYDSETKTLKLNNASINGTGVKAIEANVGGYTFTIELVGNNIIKTSGSANNVIDITGNLYFTGSGTAEVSGKGTPIYATYKIDVSADVTITNTEKAGSFTYSANSEYSNNYVGANTFAIGSGYKAYASIDGTTWAVYDNTTASENESYTTLRITKENLAPTTTVISKITVAGLTPPVKGATPVDKSNVTLTEGMTVESITWGPAESIIDGKFIAGKSYTAHIKYTVDKGYEFAANANCPQVNGADVTRWHQEGMPQDEIEVTFHTAADTPTEKPTITVSMPTPVAGNTPATANDITLTYSDINKSVSKKLSISNVVWQSYVSNSDMTITPGETLSSGDKFEAGKTYFVRITHEYVAGEYDIVPAAGITLDYTESDSTYMMLLFYTTGAPCTHEYTNDWHANGNTHWHECKLCRAHADEAEHTYGGWITDTEPTATVAGTKHRVCSVCDYVEQGNIPATGEIVPPTPDNPGTIVIIRPAEEEKPAQQPNPSTGANDLVGLAVAAAVAAALGSAALLRKHD